MCSHEVFKAKAALINITLGLEVDVAYRMVDTIDPLFGLGGYHFVLMIFSKGQGTNTQNVCSVTGQTIPTYQILYLGYILAMVIEMIRRLYLLYLCILVLT